MALTLDTLRRFPRRQTGPRQVDPTKDSFSSFERDPRDTEAACDLHEPDCRVEIERRSVASVGEVVRSIRSMSDPVQSRVGQRMPDATSAPSVENDDALEVPPVRDGFRWRIRGTSNATRPGEPDDLAVD
jgi:hypothetical protein